jgi:hypothetical protein
VRLPPLSLVVLALSALFASAPDALARNIIEGFTKAPTFTPPAGCMPRQQTYGVLSRCEKTIGPGRTFDVQIDTAVGWFKSDAPRNSEVFVTDHVTEIKSYWVHDYHPAKNLVFSSRVPAIAPANAPSHGTNCREYSISIETEETIDKKRVPTVLRVEGLTCAWRVDNAAAGKPNIELFWLEAYDEYAPSLGQQPMESFDSIVRELFASVRL